MPALHRRKAASPEEGPAPGEAERLAVDRTDMAEDRTMLANERTFADWLRTGFASAAIGLGFHALFGRVQPPWAPRAMATLFLLIAIFLFVSAERQAEAVVARLHAHRVRTLTQTKIRAITAILTVAIVAMIAAIWLLPVH